MKKLLYSLMFTTTVINAQVTTFPWTETFETSSPTSTQWVCEYITGTNSSVPSGLFWSIKSSTSVGYFGSSGAYQGSQMAVFDTRSHSRDAVARFISPVMDLSGISNPTLDFYYRNMAWDEDQNVLNIYYRTSSSGEWTLISSFDSNVPTWINSGVINLPNPSATYQIALEGVADYGYGLDVDNLKVTSSSLGVSEVASEAFQLKISPNPVSSILNISSKDKITGISIHDTSGRIIKTEEISGNQVSVEYLKPGVYFITVRNPNGTTSTSKFIKK
ncbi:MAG: T9SS type A sorting domain-containing protein [Chryseobacterium sp.]|jgi:hypothetical protein|uniref:T9SS type A sorting domain-containing protein n=1 Tax=Chryseobacterium sp. TaxID=1871047 RepID=UPI002816D13D|nr:T9SS type A sorting domain-containing protein [Chryseobacterium sp.]MDR2237480.1 T9SS type A sorting domain-containing protein [Chryseobacterium sp.]